MERRVFVVGVGHTNFTWPGAEQTDYADMAAEAITLALDDAGLSYAQVEQAVCGYVYGDSTSGQTACYRVGMTGIPVFNVNNNCATGSTAIDTARRFVKGGSKCVLACGFEKMPKGLKTLFEDREHPAQRHFAAMWKAGISKRRHLEGVTTELTESILKVYAHNAKQYMKRSGTKVDHFAQIAMKNHTQSQYSPVSLLRKPMTVKQVKESRPLLSPLTTAMSAPIASGAAAVILCDEEFVARHNLQANAVEIIAQCMTSDTIETFHPQGTNVDRSKNLCGYDLSERAAKMALESAGLTIQDVDVIEIHDAFASNELATYEALGMAKEGTASQLLDNGEWITNKNGGRLFQLGNRWFVNCSGGLQSKGHPVGATGVAQCVELCWQLRGVAGKRQVDGAKIGLQHNYGWSSCAVVTLYEKPDNFLSSKL